MCINNRPEHYVKKNQYARRMEEIAMLDDKELAHRKADQLLCEIVSQAGFGEVVRLFYNMPKWYGS